MEPLLAGVWLASLTGSLHCAGMCGGFAAFAAGGRRAATASAAYHLARAAGYAALGAAAGALGNAMDLAAGLAGFERPAAIVAAGAMIAWGLRSYAAGGGPILPHVRLPGAAQAYNAALGAAGGASPVVRAAVVGAASTLLPCGWLYAFTVVAAGTGGAATGALVMLVFWSGTVPALAAVGIGVRRLAGPLRARLPRLAAAAVVLAGVFSLASHLSLPSGAVHAAPDGRTAAQRAPVCHGSPPSR